MKSTKVVLPLLLALLFVPFAGNAQSGDMIDQALLPLPEDLRADAGVFTYDPDTGERIVLRAGTNHVECRPRDQETGFTRCYPVATAARRDLSAKLSAEGVTGEELQAALTAAEESGRVGGRVFGSVSYRLYDKDDRIRLLMVVSLPNATAAELGMPTGAQRDNALAGQGRPWMMREGTPGAHLMIPINGTELSNHP
jgi:hypothetical protein